MAQFKKQLTGDYEDVVAKIRAAAMAMGAESKYFGGQKSNSENVKISLQVYEKYFLRTNSYASLTVMAIAEADNITITAVSSAAGGGWMNISYGAEYTIIDKFKRKLEIVGF